MLRLPALVCLLLAALPRAGAVDVKFVLTDAKGAAVPEAVVSLVPLTAAARPTPPAAPLEIVQRGKEYAPFVTPLLVGSSVNFHNSDTIEHQVYSLSEPKKFELPLHKPGTSHTVTFDRPGVVIVGCNIHDWMLTYLVVLETPWFAKTATTGTATVSGAPAGRYRAEVWHPRLARVEQREVTFGGEGAAGEIAFQLTLKPDRRIRRNPDAAGAGYK